MGQKIKNWHQKKPRNMKNFRRREAFQEGILSPDERQEQQEKRFDKNRNWRNWTNIEDN